jgi:hypothetical protein
VEKIERDREREEREGERGDMPTKVSNLKQKVQVGNLSEGYRDEQGLQDMVQMVMCQSFCLLCNIAK